MPERIVHLRDAGGYLMSSLLAHNFRSNDSTAPVQFEVRIVSHRLHTHFEIEYLIGYEDAEMVHQSISRCRRNIYIHEWPVVPTDIISSPTCSQGSGESSDSCSPML